MTDAGRTHGPPATKKAGGSHHRFSQNKRHSPRDGLRLIRDLPGVPGLLATVALRLVTAKLDTSVGVPGPHDFAVRFASLVGEAPASIAPRITFRDDLEAPLCGNAGWANHTRISNYEKQKYLRVEGWTRRANQS